MERIEFSVFTGTDAEWQEGLGQLSGRQAPAFQQSATYGAIARAAGRRVARYRIARAGERLGQVQMIGRGGLWLVSRGPVLRADVSDAAHRVVLRRLARRVGLTLVTPEIPLAGVGLIPLVSARHHALWEISSDIEALRAGLRGKWRNRLNAAERAHLRVVPERKIDWILAADAAQQDRRGYRALPAAFTQAWARLAPQELLALRVETEDGVRLAGGIFLRHGAGASYHIGWTGEQGRGCGAHNLMLWQAVLRLRGQGVSQLDLGAVDSEDGAGRMRFKLGTGARPATLGPSCWVLPG